MSSGLNRNCIDKYYTSETAVSECIRIFRDAVSINPEDIIIEPSAGNGAFLASLRSIHSRVIAYDIEPEEDTIQKQDFLTLCMDPNLTYHFVGNPPFGRQSSMAKKFIKRACMYGQTVSFVLPKSFKKESFQKAFPLNFHMKSCIDLPSFSFILDGKPWDVPCVFQVWEKRQCLRDIDEKVVPTYWTYVKKDQSPHLAFRRVGVYAGRMDKDTESKSTQSHYFIRLDMDIDSFLSKYESREWFPTGNTVGPRSISKSELDRVLLTLYEN